MKELKLNKKIDQMDQKAAEQTTAKTAELYNADQSQGDAYFKPQNASDSKTNAAPTKETVPGARPAQNVTRHPH